MRKALRLIFVYFYLLLLGIIAGTLIYSLYLSITSFVLGSELKIFTFTNIYNSFFHVSYICLILICPLITYYRIRHSGGVAQLIGYIFVSLVTWCVFFPGLCVLEKSQNDKFMELSGTQILSSGYFRKSDEKVYYFTNNNSSIVINTVEEGIVDIENITLDSDFDLYKNSAPYREIDIKRNFAFTDSKLPFDIGVIVNSGKKSIDNGFLHYLCFLSFGLLICSLYVCSYFFGWKLMNSALLMFLTTLSISMNSFYFTSGFEKIRMFVNGIVPFSKMILFCGEPLLFVVNMILSLVFIIVGIVLYAVRNHKKS